MIEPADEIKVVGLTSTRSISRPPLERVRGWRTRGYTYPMYRSYCRHDIGNAAAVTSLYRPAIAPGTTGKHRPGRPVSKRELQMLNVSELFATAEILATSFTGRDIRTPGSRGTKELIDRYL